jgi:uncharacterized protein YoaH (UPF0181 family)
MTLVMKLVSLGHSARQKANRKVRQPLAEAAFSVGNADERQAVEKYGELMSDELNVKKVRLLDTSGEAVSFAVKPLPKQLGLKEAIEANRDYVTAETLTVELNYSEPVPGSASTVDEFDGEKVTVGLIKV